MIKQRQIKGFLAALLLLSAFLALIVWGATEMKDMAADMAIVH